ncbi:S41 family peptidase [Leeuwenhoekiella marinoflava]|uniref:Peptidase S41-like protein n=2 Tax=Leeuwenhoekiella marinoflava TaxID=988 RepID=A0A4Q0PF55_9FLAO|nr:S41 family peptidase [Leeuwenhoekiella marinoflava]RXG25515.1 peptidase S41-like protein [Leeuwenhoekiella marinoflava]SHF84811.1 Peptidase family S41 [Leeuwenhoekiella marinoflava DSM 3653]
MKKTAYFSLLFVAISNIIFAQSIDDTFSQKKMRKDLEVFKNIRLKANSGLYKYRSEAQIDSIYLWAEKEIDKSSTYLDFYNIICQLTDFEGSLHNDTGLPERYVKNLKRESYGYFPYPIKWIDGKWIINYENNEIPLGSEIIEINGVPISEVVLNLYKYYTTDGQNITGKRIGIRTHFSRYYRFNYGQEEKFQVSFKKHTSNLEEKKTIKSVGYSEYYKRFNNRYSKAFDQIYYVDLKADEKYKYEKIDSLTGVLTVYTFSMGNETTEEHQTYLAFLDSIFSKIKTENIKHLIVDIRQNGGGTDPNDLVTYSYLTQRNFQENKQAWISFKKVPYLKYTYTKIPRFLRPLGVGKYNKMFQEDFYLAKGNRFYQGPLSDDHKIREPNKNAFTGNSYLLISPAVASAGSLFAAMVSGNENTRVIGEETMGGYYGHNGHTPLGYILPKSKIETFFSVVNLEQDVPKKGNQIYNRGIIPDYEVSQNYEDYINQKDTQMDFVLDLIKSKATE